MTTPALITETERATLISQLEQGLGTFTSALSGLTAAQAAFAPEGRWSIAGCAEHIAIVEERVVGRLAKLAEGPPTEGRAALSDTDVLARVTNRADKLEAPPVIHPTGGADVAASIARFTEARQKTVAFARGIPHTFRATLMPHMAFGLLDGYQWLMLAAAHSNRHVAQMKEVMAHADFPGFPTLGAADVVDRLHALRAKQPVKYTAFYSSQLGGIVTDPALMVIPFDDHMVHRGHGIFDTAGIVNGKIYDLDAHLDRFIRSAERSKLTLPCSREEMRRIVIQVTAQSGRRDGSIRYWLSSGPGSLELSPAAGAEPGFFVMIFPGLAYPEKWKTDGVTVMTTTYPIKPPLYAITKTTNYMPNVLMQMEAKEQGFDNGVFLDADGHVGECSNMNVAFVSKDGALVHPKFDHILSGCTAQRILQLAKGLVGTGLITDVVVRDVSKADAHAAREMLLIGSSVKVAGIVKWDDHVIGTGKPGPVAAALLALLEEDMKTGDRLIPVPY